MNELLKQFHQSKLMREEVYSFLVQTLKDLAVENTFAKKDVTGIYEAKLAIDLAFSTLESTYGIRKEIHNQDTR